MTTFTKMVEEQRSRKNESSSSPPPSSKTSSDEVLEAEVVDDDEVLQGEIVEFKASHPRKLTPEVHETLVYHIASGKPVLVACGLVRVSKSAFYEWIQRGEDDPEGPCGQFALDVAEAQAAFKARILDQWYNLGVETKQWTAMATLLERLFPDEFKRPSEKTTNIVNIGKWEQTVHQAQAAGELPYTGS